MKHDDYISTQFKRFVVTRLLIASISFVFIVTDDMRYT
jgi:hypothetical protein